MRVALLALLLGLVKVLALGAQVRLQVAVGGAPENHDIALGGGQVVDKAPLAQVAHEGNVVLGAAEQDGDFLRNPARKK